MNISIVSRLMRTNYNNNKNKRKSMDVFLSNWKYGVHMLLRTRDTLKNHVGVI